MVAGLTEFESEAQAKLIATEYCSRIEDIRIQFKTISIEPRMRDTIAEDMHEAGASSSGGAMPPSNPPPAFALLDIVDKIRELMARELEETVAALRAQLEVSRGKER